MRILLSMRIPRGHPRNHEASLRGRVRLPEGPRQRATLTLSVAAVAGVALAALALVASSGPPGSPTADVTFVQYGVAQAVSRLAIREEPGGDALAYVEAGTRFGLGGMVDGGSSEADSYWAEVVIDGRLVRGFVGATEVALVAGDVPAMDLAGVDASTLAGWPPPRVNPGGLGIAWLPEPLARWSTLFEAAGEAHDIDPALLAIIALVESGGQPDVESSAGAVGLMQIMPGTAGDIARWRGLDAPQPADLRDPERNVDFGAYYAARMLDRFGSDGGADVDRSVELAAAAYNGGPGAAMRWLEGGQLPAETERYRGFVLGMWRERSRARSSTFEGWCRAGGRWLLPPPHCPAG